MSTHQASPVVKSVALEYLEEKRDHYATNIRRLEGQLRGVERALEVERGKHESIVEIIEDMVSPDATGATA